MPLPHSTHEGNILCYNTNHRFVEIPSLFMLLHNVSIITNIYLKCKKNAAINKMQLKSSLTCS